MRGVNKLIVEIKDTESEYFDRAILFLKPEKLGTGQSELNESAQKLLEEVRSGAPSRRGRVWIPIVIGVTVLMLLGWAALLLLV